MSVSLVSLPLVGSALEGWLLLALAVSAAALWLFVIPLEFLAYVPR